MTRQVSRCTAVLACVSAAGLFACSSAANLATGGVDSGQDAGPDGSREGDGGHDATVDASVDSSLDTGADTGQADTSIDAEPSDGRTAAEGGAGDGARVDGASADGASADGSLGDGSLGDGRAGDAAPEASTDGSVLTSCDAADMCDGKCVDLETDDQNCGGCGVACGGTCALGRCEVTLATLENWSYFLAIDATNVYFTSFGGSGVPVVSTNGSVAKVPLAGGPITILAMNQAGPAGIAVDASNVYWVNYSSGSVMSVPILGGAPTTIATGAMGAWKIAVDATTVYWSLNPVGSGGGKVLMAPLTAGGAAGTPIAGGFDAPVSVAIDGTNVYWSETSLGGTAFVNEAPLAGVPEGGLATTLYSGTFGAAALLVTSSSLLWTYGAPCTTSDAGPSCPGAVLSFSLSGGSPVPIVTGLNAPNAIAVDATSVYWSSGATAAGPGGVMKAALGGGGSSVTLANLAGPVAQSMAVDGTSVYWATPYNGSASGTGTITKVTPK